MRTRFTKAGIKALFLSAVVFLVLTGCGGKGQVSSVQEEKPVESEFISPEGYNHFVNANLLEIFGINRGALVEYEKALKYFPESSTIRTDYARLLFRMSEIPEALDQALKIEPKTSEINLLIGDCYRLLEKFDNAAGYYHRAVEQDPENVNALWYLAGYFRQTDQADSVIATYYKLANILETDRIWFELGSWLANAERFDEAEEAYRKAIELNPDTTSNVRAWLELGVLLGRAEKYEGALEAFSNSIRLDSTIDNIAAYLGLATTYDAMDSIARSEAVYDKLVKMAPDEVRIYRQMLTMYLGRENIEKAIEVSEELVALVPSDWVAQRRLGILLYTDRQLERADSLFEDRINFGDDNVFNFFYRGRIAVEQERLDDARGFFEKAIKKEPAFVDSWLNLGYILSEQDSIGQAVDLYRKGLGEVAQHEDSIRLYFALGAALERNGQFYEAVSTFKDLIAMEKNHAPALNYLGYMLADRGEELLYALELINRALEISPNNGAYIDSYAWVQYKLGNYDLALAELQKAISLMDDDAVLFEHLGDVYKALGDLEKAEHYYRRALDLDPGSLKIEEKLEE